MEVTHIENAPKIIKARKQHNVSLWILVGFFFFIHSFCRMKSGESQLKLKQLHTHNIMKERVRMHVCGHIKSILPAGSDSLQVSFQLDCRSVCHKLCFFCFVSGRFILLIWCHGHQLSTEMKNNNHFLDERTPTGHKHS